MVVVPTILFVPERETSPISSSTAKPAILVKRYD